MTANKKGLHTRDVIVQPMQGSLTIEAETDTPGVQWPGPEEIAAAINEVLSGEPSMRDGIQGYAVTSQKGHGGIRLFTEKTINLTKFFKVGTAVQKD